MVVKKNLKFMPQGNQYFKRIEYPLLNGHGMAYGEMITGRRAETCGFETSLRSAFLSYVF
jgi:hypothetical protein